MTNQKVVWERGLADLFDLTGKVTVVTGGNGGIGLGFARGIAKQRGALAVWGRSVDKNAAAKRELEALGVRVITQVIDVADEQQVIAGYDEVMAEYGRIDCVIANSGIFTPAPSVLDIDTPRYRELLATNLDGAFFTLREGARHMVRRAEAGEPGGSLIACGSLSIYLGVPGMAHYAAAKGGLASIIRSMAVDLGRYGIRANMIAPGWINTSDGPSPIDERVEVVTPMGRMGRPEDLEGIAAYLASDAARYHSGDTIVIDGAYLVNLA